MRKTVSVRKNLVMKRKVRLTISRVRSAQTLPVHERYMSTSSLQAADLFACFTADIIKKDVLFTR